MLKAQMSILAQLILTLGIIGSGNVRAHIRLPKLVGDNMVLQRNSTLLIWGWADPGEEITIDFHGQRCATKTNDIGQWSVSMGPYSAGGPYEMSINGKTDSHLKNILVGDVWLASGQSNMEFPLGAKGDWMTGVNDAEVEIARARFPQMRIFTVNHDAALKPQSDVDSEGWHPVTPETVGNFSAVAYLFGRELHGRYDVPIGLIQSTWGGTAAEAWMSASALHPFPEFQEAIDAIALADEDTQNAYKLYRSHREKWHEEHGTEDRGRANGRDLWADPSFDTATWPAISEPRSTDASAEDFNGFDGVVWFRRALALPPDSRGKDVILRMGFEVMDDVTYFNGFPVGETKGPADREYVVPGKYVHAGENAITVRLVGNHDPNDPDNSGIGMYGPQENMRAEIGTRIFSLAGRWYYQPGPDLDSFPVTTRAILSAKPSAKSPTELFNGMINPLLHFKIKGVIWYQGERNANTGRSIQYRTLFPALIRDWRQHWGYQLPFLFVQLAGFGAEQPENLECQWAELREAQAMTLSLPNTGMATAVDLGDAGNIHPRNKQDVARRLALVAAKVAYGEDVVYSGPVYQSAQAEGSRIRIRFLNIGGGLLIKDKYGYVRGFEIAGSDGKFAWAQALRDGSDMVVFNQAVKDPVAVRYDWSNTPDGNLYNSTGLPAVPFRSVAK